MKPTAPRRLRVFHVASAGFAFFREREKIGEHKCPALGVAFGASKVSYWEAKPHYRRAAWVTQTPVATLATDKIPSPDQSRTFSERPP